MALLVNCSNVKRFPMNIHPEMQEGPLGELMKSVSNMDTVPVKCKNCGSDTLMNAAYAKYVTNGLDSCSQCRS